MRHKCDFCGEEAITEFQSTWFCDECRERYEEGTLNCRICGKYITQEEFDDVMRCKECLEAGVDEW